jgi:hypothetical protein
MKTLTILFGGIFIVVAGVMIADHLTKRLEQRAADARQSECIREALASDGSEMRLAGIAVFCMGDE